MNELRYQQHKQDLERRAEIISSGFYQIVGVISSPCEAYNNEKVRDAKLKTINEIVADTLIKLQELKQP